MEGISEEYRLRFIYEGDQWKIIIQCEKNIKSQVISMGFSKEYIQLVYSVEDIPNYSVLFIILPEYNSNNNNHPSDYEKLINNYIGYDRNKSYKDFRIFANVYFFGQSSEFIQFHLGLDRFITNHKQYRIIKQPYLRQNQLVHLVTLAPLNPNSNISLLTKNFEELQFPNTKICY
ncbi:hypothetical protein ACTFIZ_000990 [Dictyostelium cf. discoideum]